MGSQRKSYRDLSYQRKDKKIQELAQFLENNKGLVARWGWGKDLESEGPKNILYVDLREGQVSFHSWKRYSGDNYPGKWDRQGISEHRILAFCDRLL